MTDPITIQALGTVVGASFAAGVFVQFIRIFVRRLTAQGARMLSAGAGVVFLLGAIVLTGPATVEKVIVGAIVGMQAGLAASKAVEMRVDGLNHSTRPR